METEQGCSHPRVGVDGIVDRGFDNGECVGARFRVKMG